MKQTAALGILGLSVLIGGAIVALPAIVLIYCAAGVLR